jgi:ribonuclease R
MDEYAEQSSMRERVAEEAERESVDLKKVEYMQDFVGQVFEGTISGVTSFGFFVELPNTVEGLVHVSTLTDDYYQYVEKQLMLIGDFTKKIYRIGDPVKVVLVKVNVEERLIDFEVVL